MDVNELLTLNIKDTDIYYFTIVPRLPYLISP